ncbi:MAG: OB-fold domain-containing protein [Halioglobus sp.]|nr:OB-fold domain-containing protein [Halioglobus sp.]
MSRYLGDFILPEIDRLNEPWFTSGKLMVQVCNDCGNTQHPPDDVCYGCGSFSMGFQELAGTGIVESAVTVWHAAHPDLADRVPYVVAIVSMDGAPGCNAIGNIVNARPDQVEIGQKVNVVYEHAGENLQIPQWELSEPTPPNEGARKPAGA